MPAEESKPDPFIEVQRLIAEICERFGKSPKRIEIFTHEDGKKASFRFPVAIQPPRK